MNKYRVLIIGSQGQLGTDMVNVFQESGNFVTGMDFPQIDITNQNMVLSIVNSIKPHFIINCAAYTSVDDCEEHQNLAFAVNAQGSENLALSAEKHDATLVHISTDYVFDGKKTTPYIESDLSVPLTVYGKSKLEGERLISNHCQKHMILRIAWLYGTHGNNFVKAIRNAAQKKSTAGEALRVVNDQIGTPTYTREVCTQVLKSIQYNSYGIFHCTCEGQCSWYDFAREIVEASGIDVSLEPCTTEEFPRPAPRPAYSVLENSRLKELNINTVSDWKNAFKKFLKEESQSSMRDI